MRNAANILFHRVSDYFIPPACALPRTYQLRQWVSWDTNEKTDAWYFAPLGKFRRTVPEVNNVRSIPLLHAGNWKEKKKKKKKKKNK